MQHAMPSSVALWCGAFDEGFTDAVAGLMSVHKRINKNPLGSAAGYGTPGLPLDREFTTRRLGFDETQSPVTAAQLSRGKAESALLFEVTLLVAVLHAGVCLRLTGGRSHHGFVDHAAKT
jgi:argininosuccinate lyase